MRRLVADAGLDSEVEVESAGTGGWHVGHPPDERATSAAAARGIDLSGEARKVMPADFREFDLLIAMDRSNRDALLEMAPNAEARRKVFLLREFGEGAELDVPDPYYGGDEGFEEVLDIVERSCEALLHEVRSRIAA